jgi:hypothetical protein
MLLQCGEWQKMIQIWTLDPSPDIPDDLVIEENSPFFYAEKVYELCEGDMTKEAYFYENYTLDDYYKWLAFKVRANEIQGFFIKNDKTE